jgi:aspartate kinase
LEGPITAKFGGTSVASAEQIRKLSSILQENPRRRYVVVSAPGKRNSSDKKVTDLLYLCYQIAAQGVNIRPTFDLIRERYETIASDLGVEGISCLLDETETKINEGASEDWIASRGEYLHARLIASHLNATFVDAAELIRFNSEGLLDPASYEIASQRLRGDGFFVIPGFYGLDSEGQVKTFSRGGSDITGAIIARATGSVKYENWTDVSGLLMADPRIVENPKPIQEVSYRELRELAYMGASVLHDETVFPVREVGIPIHIKNTNAPGDPGTLIVENRAESEDPIVGVAGKVGFTTLFVEKALMNAERGFGRRFLEILEHHGISWEHAPTGIDSMSVIMREEEIKGKERLVMDQIRLIMEPDRVESYENLALIATVGNGMSHRVGVASKLFSALSEAEINVRMINQGASEINIIVGVEADDFAQAVRAIYRAFVS